jgi:trans-aconitate 2-methyltransferase
VTTTSSQQWNPNLYDDKHAFVWQYGAGVVQLLDPKRGERILDVGCGTGHLTKQIADAGADVFGVDASAEMIGEARRNFPALKFEVADATAMVFDQPFDAVFSNAALHWVKPPEAAVQRIHDAMRPGGRFVAEFGGKGNVQQTLSSAARAAREMGLDIDRAMFMNYFPSISEYAGLLESYGFDVTFATLFDRPTKLDGDEGLRAWLRMFRGEALKMIPVDQLEQFFVAAEKLARPTLFYDGAWHADYRRLRVVARRTG